MAAPDFTELAGEEQARIYRDRLRSVQSRLLVIRAADLAGDDVDADEQARLEKADADLKAAIDKAEASD